MHAFTLDPAAVGSTSDRADLLGVVVCEDVRLDGRRLRKGHRLLPDDLAVLPRLERPVHAVRLEAEDVHEDEAGRRLAAAVGGPGVAPRGPVQSRVNLVAAVKGLLRVDGAAVVVLNRLDGVAVFTLQDRLPVLPGKIVAGCKITPVAVPAATLVAAETVATAGSEPVVQVKPFRPRLVGVVTTEGMSEKIRDRFRRTV